MSFLHSLRLHPLPSSCVRHWTEFVRSTQGGALSPCAFTRILQKEVLYTTEGSKGHVFFLFSNFCLLVRGRSRFTLTVISWGYWIGQASACPLTLDIELRSACGVCRFFRTPQSLQSSQKFCTAGGVFFPHSRSSTSMGHQWCQFFIYVLYRSNNQSRQVCILLINIVWFFFFSLLDYVLTKVFGH